jgi:aldose 1-epimerase
MTKLEGLGYDDNFCVTKGSKQGLTFVSRTLHPHSGRILEVYSDQPGVQFYTSNFMPDPDGNVSLTETQSTISNMLIFRILDLPQGPK